MDEIVRDVRVERYYPSVVAPSAEFKVLAEIENPEFTVVWERVWRRFANTFVYEIDEEGAARWEVMLRMVRGDNLPLEERKRRILARIRAMVPYTIRSFRTMLDAMFGDGNVVPLRVLEKRELWLDVARTQVFLANGVRRFARVIAPANLTINISSTANITEHLYFAGIVRCKRITVIYSGGDISYDVPAAQMGFAGTVKRSKHIVIRSE